MVFEPEQIHILGSKQDIEGFKNWTEKNNGMLSSQKLLDNLQFKKRRLLMASCRIIKSPRTGKEVTSKTWNDIRKEVNTDQEADMLYEQLLSPSFISRSGDWTTEKSPNVVTTEDGEPLLLWHGTEAEFNEFDEKYSVVGGFHFGTKKAAIERKYDGGLDYFGTSEEDALRDLEEEGYKLLPVFLFAKNLVKGVDYVSSSRLQNISEEEYEELYYIGNESNEQIENEDERRNLYISFYDAGIITREDAISLLKGETTLQKVLNADGYYYENKLEDKGVSEISTPLYNVSSVADSVYATRTISEAMSLHLSYQTDKAVTVPAKTTVGLLQVIPLLVDDLKATSEPLST